MNKSFTQNTEDGTFIIKYRISYPITNMNTVRKRTYEECKFDKLEDALNNIEQVICNTITPYNIAYEITHNREMTNEDILEAKIQCKGDILYGRKIILKGKLARNLYQSKIIIFYIENKK